MKKLQYEKGVEIVQNGKDKIIESSCVGILIIAFFYYFLIGIAICVKTAKKCVENGLLPFKVKGFKLATSLENPYISNIGVRGLAYKVL